MSMSSLTPMEVWQVQHERTSQLRMELVYNNLYHLVDMVNTLTYEQEEELFARILINKKRESNV
jgi:hypothetical protein